MSKWLRVNRPRVVFWSLFLPTSLAVGYYFWQQGVPRRVARYVDQIADPDPVVAARGWHLLNQLYRSRWDAFDPTLEHVGDPRPIHFRMVPEVPPALLHGMGRYSAAPEPMAGRFGCCRTVGETVCAMAWNEGRWRVAFRGSWSDWWRANRGYYGRTDPLPDE